MKEFNIWYGNVLIYVKYLGLLTQSQKRIFYLGSDVKSR